MNVLHLVGGELTGKAACDAYWLHLSQRAIGVDSTLLTYARETLGDFFVDLTRFIVAYKRSSLPKHMKVVEISHWLSECAQSSRVFDGYEIQT